MSEPNPVSAVVGNVPNTTESFGTIPNVADDFGTLPKVTARKESHTLTVREVARMFETAGVARTERSITNWCQPNKLGVSRLDAYFDPNERRYFISAKSVELAITEEQAKAAKANQIPGDGPSIPNSSEDRSLPHSSTRGSHANSGMETLEWKLRDLEITNKVKDQVIQKLEKEQQRFVDKLMASSHRIGVLETKLLQLGAPREDGSDDGFQADVES